MRPPKLLFAAIFLELISVILYSIANSFMDLFLILLLQCVTVYYASVDFNARGTIPCRSSSQQTQGALSIGGGGKPRRTYLAASPENSWQTNGNPERSGMRREHHDKNK
jgi:hypothetical protein